MSTISVYISISTLCLHRVVAYDQLKEDPRIWFINGLAQDINLKWTCTMLQSYSCVVSKLLQMENFPTRWAASSIPVHLFCEEETESTSGGENIHRFLDTSQWPDFLVKELEGKDWDKKLWGRVTCLAIWSGQKVCIFLCQC